MSKEIFAYSDLELREDKLHYLKSSDKPFLMLEMVLLKIMELDSTLKIEELLEKSIQFGSNFEEKSLKIEPNRSPGSLGDPRPCGAVHCSSPSLSQSQSGHVPVSSRIGHPQGADPW